MSASMDVDTPATGTAEDLAKVKKQLDKKPYDYGLHQRRVELAKQLELPDELEQARTDWAERYPLPEGISESHSLFPSDGVPLSRCKVLISNVRLLVTATWLEWLNDRRSNLAKLSGSDAMEASEQIIGLYMKALGDYLCMSRVDC
jgi:hypothetical protein